MKEKIVIVILAVFFVALFLQKDLIASSVSIGERRQTQLHDLSVDELRELKDLFHFLFAENEFGYSLLGEKPMSFCFLPTASPHIATQDHMFKIYMRGERSYRKGVMALRKLGIENFHDSYKLILYEENKIPSFAIIINKKAFVTEINRNIDAFKLHYDPAVTAESLLENLSDKRTFFNLLFNQHLLLGIMLGYGRHNAELFQRRAELSSPSFKIPFLLNRKPNIYFSSVEEELQYLAQHLQPIMFENPYLLLVNCVNFAADPSWPETLLLKKKYASIHKELTEIFKQDDWLDSILIQIEERF